MVAQAAAENLDEGGFPGERGGIHGGGVVLEEEIEFVVELKSESRVIVEKLVEIVWRAVMFGAEISDKLSETAVAGVDVGGMLTRERGRRSAVGGLTKCVAQGEAADAVGVAAADPDIYEVAEFGRIFFETAMDGDGGIGIEVGFGDCDGAVLAELEFGRVHG